MPMLLKVGPSLPPAASASPGNLLKMQIPGPYPEAISVLSNQQVILKQTHVSEVLASKLKRTYNAKHKEHKNTQKKSKPAKYMCQSVFSRE
jgi:hypothetical protein